MAELAIILLLCVILLKPKDIEFLIKNITQIILKINKYINQIKKDLLNL
ncbi:Uncharacterised protein [Candidatus Azoamicus ciliaticola]|uniref:Uncharacterized protein n=1 Tax=Candidatus Azoamicus ciliaticola TaxID=2652803 RepID=A0A6J5JWW3_9GAMM|nr:Uncharacterised protein [Candidatus Azoamicus ciliaticola]